MKKPLISHVGIAVKDLKAATATYKMITGDTNPYQTSVVDQKVAVAIFQTTSAPGGRIELVAATDTQSPIARFIEKNGEGLHHICIYVDDIETRLQEMKDAGMRLIDETPRIGAEGNKIAFVHPKDTHGVLIELEEIVRI